MGALPPDLICTERVLSLLDAGKPKKVALTACARKLLTILNTMARTGVHFRPLPGLDIEDGCYRCQAAFSSIWAGLRMIE